LRGGRAGSRGAREPDRRHALRPGADGRARQRAL